MVRLLLKHAQYQKAEEVTYRIIVEHCLRFSPRKPVANLCGKETKSEIRYGLLWACSSLLVKFLYISVETVLDSLRILNLFKSASPGL